jgi:hypothetical protein
MPGLPAAGGRGILRPGGAREAERGEDGPLHEAGGEADGSSGKLNVRALLLAHGRRPGLGQHVAVNKALLAYMSPIWSVALRTYISMLTLFAISLCLTGLVLPARQDLPVLISMVVLHMVAFTILSQLALQWVPAGRSAVLAYTSVLVGPDRRRGLSGRDAVAAPHPGPGARYSGLMAIFDPFHLSVGAIRTRSSAMPCCCWRRCCGRRALCTTVAISGVRRRFSWRLGKRCWPRCC